MTDRSLARDLRGFGPAGIVAILLILLTGNVIVANIVVPVGAVLALIWVRLSKTPWRDVGYVRPKSWLLTIVAGILIGIALKMVMKAVVMPLLGADPVNRAYHYLAGNTALLPTAIWAMFMAGFGEETVFRGYAFERLGKLLGTGTKAKGAMVLLTSLWFGTAHLATQGRDGAVQGVFTGLAFGTMYALTRSIWMPMIAHASFDLIALAIIYQELEEKVAHFFFR